jgi:hypothetical protein
MTATGSGVVLSPDSHLGSGTLLQGLLQGAISACREVCAAPGDGGEVGLRDWAFRGLGTGARVRESERRAYAGGPSGGLHVFAEAGQVKGARTTPARNSKA